MTKREYTTIIKHADWACQISTAQETLRQRNPHSYLLRYAQVRGDTIGLPQDFEKSFNARNRDEALHTYLDRMNCAIRSHTTNGKPFQEQFF